MSVKNEFLKLLSLEQANKIIVDNFSWKRLIENIPIENAISRVLGENILAKVDVPPFDRSRMDGYAVRARDTFEIDEIHPNPPIPKEGANSTTNLTTISTTISTDRRNR